MTGEPFDRTRTGQAAPAPVREMTLEEIAVRASAAIADQHPGVIAWWGQKTGRCWAMVPGVPRLVEAATFGALSYEVARSRGVRLP